MTQSLYCKEIKKNKGKNSCFFCNVWTCNETLTNNKWLFVHLLFSRQSYMRLYSITDRKIAWNICLTKKGNKKNSSIWCILSVRHKGDTDITILRLIPVKCLFALSAKNFKYTCRLQFLYVLYFMTRSVALTWSQRIV